MKPKYWAILLLAVAAVCAGVFYYLKQPAPDLGPVSVHHAIKKSNQATATPLSQTDISGWKTYTSRQYKFLLKYPPDFSITQSPGYKMSDFYACYLLTCQKILHVDVSLLDLTDPSNSYYRRIQEPDYLSGIFYYYSEGTFNLQSKIGQILSTFKFIN